MVFRYHWKFLMGMAVAPAAVACCCCSRSKVIARIILLKSNHIKDDSLQLFDLCASTDQPRMAYIFIKLCTLHTKPVQPYQIYTIDREWERDREREREGEAKREREREKNSHLKPKLYTCVYIYISFICRKASKLYTLKACSSCGLFFFHLLRVAFGISFCYKYGSVAMTEKAANQLNRTRSMFTLRYRGNSCFVRFFFFIFFHSMFNEYAIMFLFSY